MNWKSIFITIIGKLKIGLGKKYPKLMITFKKDLFSQVEGWHYKFEMVKDSVANKTAWITYIDEKGKKGRLKVVKIDSKWLVHLE